MRCSNLVYVVVFFSLSLIVVIRESLSPFSHTLSFLPLARSQRGRLACAPWCVPPFPRLPSALMLRRSLVRRCAAAAGKAAAATAAAVGTGGMGNSTPPPLSPAAATSAKAVNSATDGNTAAPNPTPTTTTGTAAVVQTAKAAGHKTQQVAKPTQSKLAYCWDVIREGLRHMYHGFRLLLINTRLAWKYSRQLKNGVALTRRERLLLERSTQDLLHLVPFSFFIIVPFAELLLPVALKMFPSLIPSTFETESQGRKRAFGDAMKTLRARQRVMEYVSATALTTFDKDQQEVIRRSVMGDSITPKDIRLVAPYFGRDSVFSIYKIPDSIAMGLGRILGVYKWYHALLPTFLVAPLIRRGILRHYHALREDDRLLRVEGFDDLTKEELTKANQVRGMRWMENKDTLQVQLEWWSGLARDPSVPYNTLFWLQPTRYSLRKTMNSLPVEQRRQLLGIQNLPESVRSSLEALCDTVDTVSKIEDEPDSADQIVEKIEVMTDSVNKSDADAVLEDAQVTIGTYLTEDNVNRMFEKLQKGKLEEEPVILSDVIECIGQETHNSSHVVSTLFDAFDYSSGSKLITAKAVVAIGARCREAAKKVEARTAAAEGAEKAKQTTEAEKAKPSGGAEKTSASATK